MCGYILVKSLAAFPATQFIQENHPNIPFCYVKLFPLLTYGRVGHLRLWFLLRALEIVLRFVKFNIVFNIQCCLPICHSSYENIL